MQTWVLGAYYLWIKQDFGRAEAIRSQLGNVSVSMWTMKQQSYLDLVSVGQGVFLFYGVIPLRVSG